MTFNNIPPKKDFFYSLKTNDNFIITITNPGSLEQIYTFRVIKNDDKLTFKEINYQIFDTSTFDDTYKFKYIIENINLDDIVPVTFESTMSWSVLELLFREFSEGPNMYEKLEEALRQIN